MTTITKPRERTKTRARKKRKDVHPVVPALVALLGVLLLLYPVFATQHNDIEQQKRANGYTVTVQGTDKAALERSLNNADRYNADLAAGVLLDPFLTDVVPNTPQYQEYLSQLSEFDEMAQLKVPAANINLPIYHGTTEEVLKIGAGHLFGSSLPVGGESSHTIVTGHTGLGDATLFNNLTNVKNGDAIYVNTAGRKLKYVVNDIRTVLPTDVSSLVREPGKDLITLITCHPYGINSHRLLVTGERAPLDEVDEQVVDEVPEIKPTWKWWMVALLIGAIVSIIVVSALLIRLSLLRKKRKAVIVEETDEDNTIVDDEDDYTGRRRADEDGSGHSVDEIIARETASSNKTSKGRARTRGERAGAVSVAKLLEAKAKKKAEKQAKKDAKAKQKQEAAEAKRQKKADKKLDSASAAEAKASDSSGDSSVKDQAKHTDGASAVATPKTHGQSPESADGTKANAGTKRFGEQRADRHRPNLMASGKDKTSPATTEKDSDAGSSSQLTPSPEKAGTSTVADTPDAHVSENNTVSDSTASEKSHHRKESGSGKASENTSDSTSIAAKSAGSHGAKQDASTENTDQKATHRADKDSEPSQAAETKPDSESGGRRGRHRIGDGESLTLQQILERRNKR